MIYFFMTETFLQNFLGIYIVCIITNSFNTMFYTDYTLQYKYISNYRKTQCGKWPWYFSSGKKKI